MGLILNHDDDIDIEQCLYAIGRVVHRSSIGRRTTGSARQWTAAQWRQASSDQMHSSAFFDSGFLVVVVAAVE